MRGVDVALARSSPSSARRLDVAAAACLLTGNTIGGYIFPPDWMVLGLFPPVFIGLGLVAFRCAVFRQPSLWQTWRRGAMTPALRARIFVFAAATRVVVLAVGFAASLATPERLAISPRISPNLLVTLPARWDAFWYLSIARYGYTWDAAHAHEQQNIAFFPAYPFAMRLAGDLITIPAHVFNAPSLFGNGDGRVVWGGVVATIAFFLIALPRVHRLALEESGDRAAADRACILLTLYPYALFFSAPYSEALALAALTGLVLAWRHGDARGGLWGLVFGLCRSNGWSVALAIAADAAVRRPRARRPIAWWLFASAPIGAALYCAYIYHLTGHPFQWAAAQEAWGATWQPLAFITRRWNTLEHIGLRRYFRRDPADIVAFATATAMVACGIWLAARRRTLYGVLMVSYLAPAIAIDLPATGRMTALLFPAFIVLGAKLKRTAFVAVAVGFAAVQVWFAWRFFSWLPPY